MKVVAFYFSKIKRKGNEALCSWLVGAVACAAAAAVVAAAV